MKRDRIAVGQDDIGLNHSREFIAAFIERKAAPNFASASKGVRSVESKSQVRRGKLMMPCGRPISLTGWSSSSGTVIRCDQNTTGSVGFEPCEVQCRTRGQ